MNFNEMLKNYPLNDEYSNDGKRMGVALIFNQVNFPLDNLPKRNGSIKDKDDLRKVLTNLAFDVREFEDLTSADIRKRLQEAANENHAENNCLLVTMMTHGDQYGIIHTNDGEIYTEDLWKPFIDTNSCPSLVGKPKIFFIQACRGNLKDVGAFIEEKPTVEVSQAKAAMLSGVAAKKIPTYSFDDVLIYFSTAEGYPSFKGNNGSWFIQSICKNLNEARKAKYPTDFLNILTRVNREVAYSKQADTRGSANEDYNACKQMPVVCSMLTKIFYIGGNDDSESEDED